MGRQAPSGAGEAELDILHGPLRPVDAAEYEGVRGILADILRRAFT